MTFHSLLFEIVLIIHVLSAIVGLGPGFVMIYIVKRANNMEELRQFYHLRHNLHIFVMIGGSLLLITGLWMGLLRPYLFHLGWYVTSLVLFLIALGFGPIILSPKSKPIKALLKNYEGKDIPPEYFKLSRKLFFFERFANALFIIIIILMIAKPF